VQFLEGVSEVVEAAAGESVALDDPNDDPVIYAAVAGNVDVLCTLDRDFFAPGVVTFCSRRGIMILSDLDLLLKLRPPQPSA
jgi:predicted nuclease of predicted toxin-antitoxin system